MGGGQLIKRERDRKAISYKTLSGAHLLQHIPRLLLNEEGFFTNVALSSRNFARNAYVATIPLDLD